MAASTIYVTRKIPRLIDLMRSTLERVERAEQSEEQQRSAVRGLRRSVVLTIAEREVRKAQQLSPETAGDSAA